MYIQTKKGPFLAQQTVSISVPTGYEYKQIGIEYSNAISIKNATGVGQRTSREGDFVPTPVLTPTMVESPMSSFVITPVTCFDDSYNNFFINENNILEFNEIVDSITTIYITPQQYCDEYTIITAGYKEIGG